MSNATVPHDTDTITKVTERAVQDNQKLEGALLPILHQIQHELGYVPESSVPILSKALNLSRAEVHGVISYYHSFTDKPRGKTVVEICRAESCQAMGGIEIESHIKQTLGVDYDQTTDDGKFTLEAVYCLGNCACSPSMRINDDIYGRLTAKSAEQLIDKHS